VRRIAIAFVLALAIVAETGFGSNDESKLSFKACGRPKPIVCATVSVPLDRNGTVPGELRLAVEKVPARTDARGVLVAIAGGPGQSSTALTASFRRWLAPALSTRDLVVVDLRGTGRSGFLSCGVPDRRCENSIPGIHAYTTRDSADDLEAVREALGVDQMTLYGVSYGTKVAQAYAKRYPAHVKLMVLDSVVRPNGWDFYERNSFAAVDSVLHDVCARGRCDKVTSDYPGDVAALASRAAASAVQLPTIGPQGLRGEPVALSPRRLFDVVATGASIDPVIRALAPAAVHAALAGDGLPLSRLVYASEDLPGRAEATFFSPVAYRASACEELAPGWWRVATTGERISRLEIELTGAEAAFVPFGPEAGIAGTPSTCIDWAVATNPPLITGSGPPNVRVLLLDGRDDTVTPVADAQAVAALYPQSTLLVVPDMGHAVLATNESSSAGCVRRALRQFLRAAPVSGCPDTPPRLRPVVPAPESLEQLAAWPSLRGARGRIVRAVLETLADVRLTSRSKLLRRRGLRGGLLTLRPHDLHLTDVVVVEGVAATGNFAPARGTADLTIAAGTFGHGHLVLGQGILAGKLLGQSIHVAVPKRYWR
jgi:pimeloyl-ACP methyl ester carboxylesterase